MKRMDPATVALVCHELMCRSPTYHELSDLTGLSLYSLYRWIGQFRRKGLVFVVAWDKDSLGRRSVPRFSWGLDRIDVARPAVPPVERKRKSRAIRRFGGTA